jgi:glucose/arabinose dehydrogenase/mono/diheme cytochrome c family protein
MKLNSYSVIAILLCSSILFNSCDGEKKYTDNIYQKPVIVKDPPINFLSPEESMKTMYLPEGYHVELVASEPMINEPVAMAWDADGKLYVAEMLTYMQDVDGTNQQKPWSRISLLEDIDGDGVMDKSTVFIDSLVLPRIILPLDDRVIVGETYDRSMWSYRDTDGDHVADEKEMLLENKVFERKNLEHQSGSLMWSIDNWMYLSMDAIRYRFTHGKIETDTLRDAPSGQWGLSEDENGQPYYSSAGGETAALGYQQHPYYGVLEMPGKWEEGFEKVWPVTGTPDVQGGLRRLREDGTLNHFTASCGQSIFLGDKLPAYGDLFIPEPVGRLIRRAKVNNIDGKKVLSNVYDKTEFLASTDMNFRPVDTKTGPDGCLYVLDMYRGIIQEGNWTRKGSFLREVVTRKGFDKNIGKGRIYRIVHDEIKPSKREKLLGKSSKELLKYLSHPNAWYRMNAQKLIVLRKDAEVIPELKEMVQGKEPFLGSLFSDNDFELGRLHALWTLEGLDAIDEDLVIEKLQDVDPRIRRAALRISERYLEKGNQEVFKQVEALQNDVDKEVIIQLELSLRSNKDKDAKSEIIKQIIERHPNNEMIVVTGEESIKEVPLEVEVLKQKYILESSNVKKRIVDGYHIYKGLCIACHGDKGQGIEGLAPTLVNSPRVKGHWHVPFKILLDGLAGPIDGKEYAGVMVGMKQQDNDWMAAVLTYIRVHFNDASPVAPWQMDGVRKEVKNRDTYWTLEELNKKKNK